MELRISGINLCYYNSFFVKLNYSKEERSLPSSYLSSNVLSTNMCMSNLMKCHSRAGSL